jgi:hypothetical protein
VVTGVTANRPVVVAGCWRFGDGWIVKQRAHFPLKLGPCDFAWRECSTFVAAIPQLFLAARRNLADDGISRFGVTAM